MKTLLPIIVIVLLSTFELSAQNSTPSDKEKIQILAQQISIRDGQIAEMKTEISKLNKKLSKKKTSSSPPASKNNKELETTKEQLAQTIKEKEDIQEKLNILQAQMSKAEVTPNDDSAFQEERSKLTEDLSNSKADLAKANEKNVVLEQKIQSLETQLTDLQNQKPSTANNNIALENQIKEGQVQINSLKTENQNLEVALNQKQNSILRLQEQLQSTQTQQLVNNQGNQKKKSKNVNSEIDIPNKPIKGRNYFYITASKNLEVDNAYGVEIGSLKNFNKRSSSRVKLGLDIAYLSASLINVDLDNLDEVIEEPAGAIGLKLGPNIGVRLVKGIHVNFNYRYFAAANLTVLNDETNVDYKGFHTAGASVKVGPIVGRAEWDISNIIEDESDFDTSPLTVYLGLMF